MAQIFSRHANAIARGSLILLLVVIIVVTWALFQLQRSPVETRQGEFRTQPVPFSHEHHVAGLGIDCRYCHTSVETSSFAGIPPTKTCMNCHSEIWTTAAILEPVRASFRSGVSLEWQRVNELPDFVFFQHDIHIHKGVGCDTCHGHVDRMPLMLQAQSLQMVWCVNCHKAPWRYLRPRNQVFNTEYVYPPDQKQVGMALMKRYHVRSPTEITGCFTCHR